jgi:hypothetical protein
MTTLELELIPGGEPDARHAPRQRQCSACGAQLFTQDHAPRCPERARIFRLNVTHDPVQRRLEDLLEACTKRAFAQPRSP